MRWNCHGGWRVGRGKNPRRRQSKRRDFGLGGSRASRAGNGEREARRNACYCPTSGVRLAVDRYDLLNWIQIKKGSM